MLYGKHGRKDDLVVRGARVLDPAGGRGRGARRPRRQGHDRRARRGARRERPPRGRRRRARARAGLRRPARAPARAGRGGRGDDRLGHRGRRGRRLLRDPGDAEHRPGRRLGRGARLADRGREGAGGDPGRLPRRDHPRPGRRRADRDGRARRPGRGRLHRRRPPGRRAEPDAPRAPVPRHHRPAARAALRGADALEGRPDARGRGLRRARLHRLPVGGREPDGRARPLARRLRGRAAAPAAPLGAGVGRARCGRRRPRASRPPPRSRRTTSASPTRRCARSTRT